MNSLQKYLLPLLLVSLTTLTACTTNTSESTTISGTSTTTSTSSTQTSVTTVSSSDITLNNTSITIDQPGTYTIDGTISDGQIIVNVGEDQEVTLNLAGISVTNTTGTALYIQSGKATINLVDGTTNTLTDGSSYSAQGDEDPNATLYAVEDLVITGNGILTVKANYNDAISTKDDLTIEGGSITVTSVDDGIQGNDSITMNGGTITIDSEGDSFKSDNEEKGTIEINGGTLTINSSDDGIKAYSMITVNNGTIRVESSYEGMESEKIIVNDGSVTIRSSDDGINVTSSSATATEWQPTMGGTQTENSDIKLTINGWTVLVNADGDGLDANGSIEINGGNTIVYGPTNDGNGALDYDATFKVTGGSIIAFGSAGMAQNIGSTSTQNGVLINLTSQQSAGSSFTLTDSSGNTITEETSEKVYTSILVSSSSLKTGETYTYSTSGGTSGTFTVSSVTTQVGTSGGMWGGRGARPGM